MKKITIFLAAVFGAATLLNAAPVSVTGSIEEITVGALWDLTVTSTQINGADQTIKTTLASGNVGFGTIDTGSGAITADDTATGSKAYKTVAHRESSDFTQLQFAISNNSSDTLQVNGTISGTIYNIPLPDGTSGEAGADSTIHITTGYEYNQDASVATAFTSNVVLVDEAQSMLTGTPVALYRDASDGFKRSDAFRAYIALDFLPIDVPAGTYSGSTDWTLTETIS